MYLYLLLLSINQIDKCHISQDQTWKINFLRNPLPEDMFIHLFNTNIIFQSKGRFFFENFQDFKLNYYVQHRNIEITKYLSKDTILQGMVNLVGFFGLPTIKNVSYGFYWGLQFGVRKAIFGGFDKKQNLFSTFFLRILCLFHGASKNKIYDSQLNIKNWKIYQQTPKAQRKFVYVFFQKNLFTRLRIYIYTN